MSPYLVAALVAAALSALVAAALSALVFAAAYASWRRFEEEPEAPHVEGAEDGFVYWPACPTCGGPVGCYGRHPRNAVPAEVYDFRCNEHGHPSAFTHAEIMAMQARRKIEVDGS